jgi:hypothetical protein
MAWDYATIKELARERGCRVTDLIALAPNNDPMYAGKPADRQMAEWFADLWNTFGYYRGVHIRRVHYQIISQSPSVRMPNGKPYENTETCWDFLSQASKMARYLDLVDPGAFDDRRNPEAVINAETTPPEPRIEVYSNLWNAPELPEFAEPPYYLLDDYRGNQRYMIEVWCEKSTMNDVLRPLCERYGANLQTGLGELSITATLAVARRIEEADKPTRIFYVSDFDPAGQSMPVAVSRKIEYFLRNQAIDADVRLVPIVLTAEQVQQYHLPRTPIKETEKRAGKFEDRYGAGAVELDALEALYPGTLDEVLSAAIEQYYDTSLADQVNEKRRAVEDAFEEVRSEVLGPHQEAIERLRRRYEQIRADFAERLGSYNNDLRQLYEQISRELREQSIDLADHPIPEAQEADEDDSALYDSYREYLDQITAYKAFQGKE